TCRLLYVSHNLWSLLSGWTLPEEIRIDGAALQLPAMLSPTGTTEPVVSDLVAVLHHDGKIWRVEQFAGRLGPLNLTMQGDVAVTTATGAAPLAREAILSRFLSTARHLTPLLRRIYALVHPSP